jgi:adenosylcobinamide-GDP ribazoletransferase
VFPKPDLWNQILELKLGFLAALQFLTIFPIPLRNEDYIKAASKSIVYFPLIGLILGAILSGLYYVLILIIPPMVVIALLVTTLVILTGAHHLDGLADTCDGVFVGKTKKERLAIMSDTTVGAFGIIGITLLLILKYASLLSIAMILPALLLMPTLSRWVMALSIFTFPYARKRGMGLPFKQSATWQKLALSTIIALAVAVILLKWWGLVLMAILWLAAYGIGSYFQSRLGGLTGDNYGAVNEMAEVLVLLLLIIIWRFQ